MSETEITYYINQTEILTQCLENLLGYFDYCDDPVTVETKEGIAIISETMAEDVYRCLSILNSCGGDNPYDEES